MTLADRLRPEQFTVNGTSVKKGEWITVDGSTGRVFLGQVPTAASLEVSGASRRS